MTSTTRDLPPLAGRTAAMLPRLLSDPLKVMTTMPRRGPVVRWQLGSHALFFVNDPDLVGEVLIDRTEEFGKEGPQKAALRPLVGDYGLPFVEGAHWTRSRKMMSPMFARRGLQGVTDAMVGAIAEQLNSWEQTAQSGATIDLSSQMAMMTMHVLATTMFGRSLGADERQQLSDDFLLLNSWMNWRIWTMGLPDNRPVPFARRGARAQQRIDRALDAMIASKRANPGNDDLLSMLVHARDEDDASAFSDVELRDNAMSLLFAGHETTSVTTTWALALLEQHPEWAEAVADEVDRVLGDRPPTFADWPQLDIVRASWREAMRLYPPAFINGRTAVRDTELGGFHVPAGTPVMLNVVGIHHHPDHWDRPDEFDPGRFLDGGEDRRHRWAYFPFGVGPRTCIAANMGTVEAVLAIAMIYQRYRLALKPGTDVRPKVRLSIQFRSGPHMLVRRRRPAGLRADRSDDGVPPVQAVPA